MIAKVFPKGKGGIPYLLSKDFCPVLIGDPETTKDLILSSRSKNPSTAGVLSCEEYIESTQVKLNICLDFTAKVLAPGIDLTEIAIVWIEHKEGDKDKPRTGLHFEMSNTHLASGKQLQPYFGGSFQKKARRQLTPDYWRKRHWQKVTNHDYGLSDPDDPEMKQTLTANMRLPEKVKEAREAITDCLQTLIENGQVTDAASLRMALEDELGLEVVRHTKSGLSIKAPAGHKRNIRMKGAIYDPEFKITDGEGEIQTARSEAGIQYGPSEIDVARAKLARGVRRKAAKNRERYPSHKEIHPMVPVFDLSGPDLDTPPEPPFYFKGQNEMDKLSTSGPEPNNTTSTQKNPTDNERSRLSHYPSLRGFIRRARESATRIRTLAQRVADIGLDAFRPRRYFSRENRRLREIAEGTRSLCEEISKTLQELDRHDKRTIRRPRKSRGKVNNEIAHKAFENHSNPKRENSPKMEM